MLTKTSEHNISYLLSCRNTVLIMKNMKHGIWANIFIWNKYDL